MASPEWWTALPKCVQETVEQILHALAGGSIGFVAACIAVWFDAASVWVSVSAIAAAAISGAVRELAQNLGDDINDVLDAWIDWAAWSLGGVGAAILASVVF